MNRFSHVDLTAPLPPPHAGGGERGDVDARHSRRALRGVFGHEGQGGSAAR